jgi:RNA polymerase sigma-70 factor (sigma-E family)
MGESAALATAAGEVPAEEERVSASRSDRDAQVAALFDRHYPGLCRLATLLLGNAAAAEEAVQEAFVRTYTGWWRIRHPERAAAYLRAAVVNQCRSRGRRALSEERGNRTVWATERAPGRRTPEQAADTVVVMDAVRALPRRQREAVVLTYYGDLSEADVARALGCSVGTVKSQLSKARAALARQLGDLKEGE